MSRERSSLINEGEQGEEIELEVQPNEDEDADEQTGLLQSKPGVRCSFIFGLLCCTFYGCGVLLFNLYYILDNIVNKNDLSWGYSAGAFVWSMLTLAITIAIVTMVQKANLDRPTIQLRYYYYTMFYIVGLLWQFILHGVDSSDLLTCFAYAMLSLGWCYFMCSMTTWTWWSTREEWLMLPRVFYCLNSIILLGINFYQLLSTSNKGGLADIGGLAGLVDAFLIQLFFGYHILVILSLGSLKKPIPAPTLGSQPKADAEQQDTKDESRIQHPYWSVLRRLFSKSSPLRVPFNMLKYMLIILPLPVRNGYLVHYLVEQKINMFLSVLSILWSVGLLFYVSVAVFYKHRKSAQTQGFFQLRFMMYTIFYSMASIARLCYESTTHNDIPLTVSFVVDSIAYALFVTSLHRWVMSVWTDLRVLFVLNSATLLGIDFFQLLAPQLFGIVTSNSTANVLNLVTSEVFIAYHVMVLESMLTFGDLYVTYRVPIQAPKQGGVKK